MSVTGHTPGLRHPDDFYKTPEWVTRAILPHLPAHDDVMDPCCGDGAILRVAGGRGIEIDPDRAQRAAASADGDPIVLCADALTVSWDRPSLVVTNPPYALAMEFVVRAIAEVRPGGTVAMLLRLAFMASGARSDFHRAHPSDVFVLSRRPSFAISVKCAPAKGSGKQPCGWAQLFATDADLPKTCPACGDKVSIVRSDSADYGWFVWGVGRIGRWTVLEIPEEGGS